MKTDDGATVAELKERIAGNAREVLIVVGSGVSLGATRGQAVASWWGLLKDGVTACRSVSADATDDWAAENLRAIESGDPGRMIAAAEQVTEKLGGRDGHSYAAWLKRTVGALRHCQEITWTLGLLHGYSGGAAMGQENEVGLRGGASVFGANTLKTLAQVVVHLMGQLETADEPGIDWQACGDITNDVWFELAKATPAERHALAEAAAARLKELLREPDEYGYTPRALVTPAHREFLESLASGSAWEEFDRPESEDG